MTAPIRVLLVDDHALLRAGFRTILDTQPDIAVVGEASTGAEAVAQAAALRPDVITMDVQMPDMDGIEATRRLVADPSVGAAIAIVTTFDRDDYLYQALEAGASGFLLKNAGAEDLISAVRALAAGDGMLAPEVTRRVLTRFAGATPEAGAAPARAVAKAPATAVLAEPLTEREAEVLTLLADARSNAEIARALFIGEATVKTHVSRILQKLGARDRVQAVVLAHRMGLA
ncbi:MULTISPECIES: response regulator [Microbacterium]|uniref:response regulator n=1 Tax=Microbacterium TaxID=33882 RepID=UPI0021A57BE6|nr:MULTISPECIES: response regulator transcription factor [Microbacterium]MCT1364961.1 response regulator transcription factor [Microbacterium sp. p3-SID131]MCT1375855.1 response regulator transcription factor [Microbacterium sp. p3-SID337]MCZ0709918.1 response regulator transcription factor [Microbacterium paraoxydans]MDH5134180.1 response regulator transcription factor [Microbacterium sp. RD10]MDH5137628.1 response regulator transcription factor [Microbacterium sp. RD11]